MGTSTETTAPAPSPSPSTSKKTPVRDTRSLSERWCALKKRINTGAIVKNGVMVIKNNTIHFLMNDDLMELIRQMMGEEGIDARCGMDPSAPPKEIVRKTQSGSQIEYQCWFKISAKCVGENGLEEDSDWWLSQDGDIDIAATYAFKAYLIKRLHLSGGGADGIRWRDVEPPSQVEAPAEKQPSNFAPLNVTEKEAKNAQVGPKENLKAEAPKTEAGQKHPDGAKGPEKPASEEMTPEHFASQATKEEIMGAWEALGKVYSKDAKNKLVELLGRPVEVLKDLTVGETMKVWEHINNLSVDEIPF